MRKMTKFSCLLILLMFCLLGCEKQTETKQTAEWKQFEDPRGHVLESTATGETKPQIIQTKYETEDVVIADIVPTEMGYAVDASGKTDSTEGIQKALYDCYNAGGGTVFLPAGNYAISDTVYIPPYVSLRGDWQDPDEGNEYGTIISVWMESNDVNGPGAFSLGGSGGVIGLTVYYPMQRIEKILPYPYTFYVNGIDPNFMLSTIKNVTVINGYRGIGTSEEENHEYLDIDNFKGTFLNCGTQLYNQTDVGTIEDVVISNKYWKEASSDYMNAVTDADKLDAHTLKSAVGMRIGGLDWTQFGNITIDGYSIGVEVVTAKRTGLDGSMIDVNIVNCGLGMSINSLEERSGLLIARSHVDNKLDNNWIGTVKLCDVEVDEIEERAKNSIVVDESDLSAYKINYQATYKKPKSELFIADLTKGSTDDMSGELQAVLDKAAEAGGGVVYVPGGTYYFDQPITVPTGVELRGSSSVATREQVTISNGTLFMCRYGDEASYQAETDEAFITLEGKNAGLNGIRVIYPQNGPYDSDLNTTFTVRGKAEGVYIVNSMISAAAYGVDFRECDNHFISGVTTCCYYNAFRVGGKDGVLKRCRQNGTVLVRCNTEKLENWITETDMGGDLRDPILRENCEFIIVENASNQLVYQVFIYASKSLLVNRNSENTLAVCIGADNVGRNSAMLVMDGGAMAVINAIRYNGYSYEHKSGTLKLYNRVTYDVLDEVTEIVGE